MPASKNIKGILKSKVSPSGLTTYIVITGSISELRREDSAEGEVQCEKNHISLTPLCGTFTDPSLISGDG